MLVLLVGARSRTRSSCRRGRSRRAHGEHRRRRRLLEVSTSPASRSSRGCASTATRTSAREIAANRGLHGKAYKGQRLRGVPRRAPRPRREARALARRRHERARSQRRPAGRSTAATRDLRCSKCHTQRPRRSASRSSSRRRRRAASATPTRTRAGSPPRARSATTSRSGSSSTSDAFDHAVDALSADRHARAGRVRQVPRRAAEVAAAAVRDVRLVPRRSAQGPVPAEGVRGVSRHEGLAGERRGDQERRPSGRVARERPRARSRARRVTTAATTSRRRRARRASRVTRTSTTRRSATKCEQCHASIKWIGPADSIGRASHDKTKYPLARQARRTSRAPRVTRRASPRTRAIARSQFEQLRAAATPTSTRASSARTTARPATRSTGSRRRRSASRSTCRPATRSTASTRRRRAAAVIRARARASSWKQPKQQCADCHENPHGTQFDKEMKAGGCAHCHTPYAWKQAKIDHSTFPLTGAHARAACVGCHGNVAQGAEAATYPRRSRARARAATRTCTRAVPHRRPAGEAVHDVPHDRGSGRSTNFDHTQDALSARGRARRSSSARSAIRPRSSTTARRRCAIASATSRAVTATPIRTESEVKALFVLLLMCSTAFADAHDG